MRTNVSIPQSQQVERLQYEMKSQEQQMEDIDGAKKKITVSYHHTFCACLSPSAVNILYCIRIPGTSVFFLFSIGEQSVKSECSCIPSAVRICCSNITLMICVLGIEKRGIDFIYRRVFVIPILKFL